LWETALIGAGVFAGYGAVSFGGGGGRRHAKRRFRQQYHQQCSQSGGACRGERLGNAIVNNSIHSPLNNGISGWNRES